MSKSEEAAVSQVFISNEIQQEREKMAITKVFERIYLGDAEDANLLAFTNPLGISRVVNVAVNRTKRGGRESSTSIFPSMNTSGFCRADSSGS